MSTMWHGILCSYAWSVELEVCAVNGIICKVHWGMATVEQSNN